MTESKPTWTTLRRTGATAFRIGALAAAIWLASFSAPRTEAAGGGAGLYSIELTEMTIPEALKRLNEATGVPIVIRKGTVKKISARSYANQDLDRILRDLLRHADHVVRWNYLDDALSSVDIWIFDSPLPGKQDGSAPPTGFQPNEKAGAVPKLRSALRSPGDGRNAAEQRHARPAGRRMPPIAPATQGRDEEEPADSAAHLNAKVSTEEDRPDPPSEVAEPTEEKEEEQPGSEKEERNN